MTTKLLTAVASGDIQASMNTRSPAALAMLWLAAGSDAVEEAEAEERGSGDR